MQRHTIAVLGLLGLLGLMALPATSMPNPARQAVAMAPNAPAANAQQNAPVFSDDWSPFDNANAIEQPADVFSDDWSPFDQTDQGVDVFDPDNDDTSDRNDDDADDGSADDGEGEAGICIIGVDSPCNSDQWDDDSSNDAGDDRDLSEVPGCQEGEPHLPEDTDCDGEIDDRFINGSDDTPDEDEGSNEPTVTEERQVTPAPEPSAVGEDWISYPNPRDHMPNPSTAGEEPSIKICSVMLNQDNEVITGHTVSDATMSVDTDIPYSDAQPVVFDLPIDQRQDLIGTDPSLREGDGMLDASCGEYHNLPEGEYSYSAPSISGADAEQIEFVGLTEYWDATGEGDPFNQRVEDFGTSDLSDGHIPALETGNYEQQHAEVVYLFRLR